MSPVFPVNDPLPKSAKNPSMANFLSMFLPIENLNPLPVSSSLAVPVVLLIPVSTTVVPLETPAYQSDSLACVEA